MHSVLSGGESQVRRRKDYGPEVLAKIPGLYEVLRLRNFNFCCCTVCFLGEGRRRWGHRRQKEYGLEVLAKIPGLYEVPKLKNLNIFCCTVSLPIAPKVIRPALWYFNVHVFRPLLSYFNLLWVGSHLMKNFWKFFKLSLSKNSKKLNYFFAKTFEDLVFICFKHVSTQCPYQ